MDNISDQLLSDLSVPRETAERLRLYQHHLLKWQPHLNLIASTDNIIERHFIDSLQLLYYIDKRDAPLADIGTGAGFPGLVLACAGMSSVTLIESDAKKVEFLREAARICAISVTILPMRVEKVAGNFTYLTSRACASLARLLHLSEHLWAPDTLGLFLKGKTHLLELDEAMATWSFHYHIHPSITQLESAVLAVSDPKKKR